jgi:CheY-like chemotaxis protein
MQKRVLIAAEFEGAEFLKGILGRSFELIFAKDVRDATGLAKKHRPDLIICDLLFDSSGVFELLGAIRQEEEFGNISFLCGPLQPSGMPAPLVESFALVCKELKYCHYLDMLELRREGHEDQILAAAQAAIDKPGFGHGVAGIYAT